MLDSTLRKMSINTDPNELPSDLALWLRRKIRGLLILDVYRTYAPTNRVPSRSRCVHVFSIILALLLVGCGIPQSQAEFNNTPEAQYLKKTVSQLVARDYQSIESQMDERVHQPDIRAVLERLASMVPAETPSKLEPVAWNYVTKMSGANSGANSRTANVAIAYTFSQSKSLVASARLSGEPGNFRIIAFNLEALPAPLAELNAFTFTGKGILHYVFFVLTLSAFGLSAYAFVRCIRTQGFKRKWLWAVFTLTGFIAFSLNWTNGAISANPIQFNLLSASYARTGWLGPWHITFCIPFGGLMFLWRFRKQPSAPILDAEVSK